MNYTKLMELLKAGSGYGTGALAAGGVGALGASELMEDDEDEMNPMAAGAGLGASAGILGGMADQGLRSRDASKQASLAGRKIDPKILLKSPALRRLLGMGALGAGVGGLAGSMFGGNDE